MEATRRTPILAALGLLLAACAGPARADPAAVKAAEAPAAISVAGRSPIKTAMYRRSRVVIPLNKRVGEFQEGVFCSGKSPITITQRFADGVMRLIGPTFHSELSKAGYPRLGQNESLFEEKPATPPAADFDVGAVIRGMQVNFCRRGNEGLGGVWVQMRWEVYSRLARKVMYET
ncbi:MAG TPA: hypothetical protein VLV90_04560, partial [Burkholderiales bacterium]|nr:hypothetical protein [Burkholderiales bacterium]